MAEKLNSVAGWLWYLLTDAPAGFRRKGLEENRVKKREALAFALLEGACQGSLPKRLDLPVPPRARRAAALKLKPATVAV